MDADSAKSQEAEMSADEAFIQLVSPEARVLQGQNQTLTIQDGMGEQAQIVYINNVPLAIQGGQVLINLTNIDSFVANQDPVVAMEFSGQQLLSVSESENSSSILANKSSTEPGASSDSFQGISATVEDVQFSNESSTKVDNVNQQTSSLSLSSFSSAPVDGYTFTKKKDLQIFGNVRATLSKEVVKALPGSISSCLYNIQESYCVGLHHDPAMDMYSIDSTLDKLVKIERDLRKLTSGLDLLEEKLPVKQNIATQTDYAHKFGSIKESSNSSQYGEKNVMGNFSESFNLSMPKKVDAAVYCDILKPQYTRFGRQIKVKRFLEEVNIDTALEESDIPSWPHHADNLPTRPSKKKKVPTATLR